MSAETDFLDQHRTWAQWAAEALGIGADVVLAQWALETGWGTSLLATDFLNFAGIKAAFPPPEFLHFADFKSFAEQYVRTMKADCPAVRSGKLAADSQPLEVFAGSDYAPTGYGRQVQSIWLTIPNLTAAAPVLPPTSEPGHNVPLEPPVAADPDPAAGADQKNEPSGSVEPVPDAPATAVAPNPRSKVITLPAVAGLGGLAEDQWSVEVTLSNPDGSKSWGGTAQIDSGSEQTLLPGVANGIADLLGLTDQGQVSLTGVTGSATAFESKVTVAFTDPASGAKLIMSDTSCLIDPTADLLLIGAKAFIDRGIVIELDPVAKTVSFWTGG